MRHAAVAVQRHHVLLRSCTLWPRHPRGPRYFCTNLISQSVAYIDSQSHSEIAGLLLLCRDDDGDGDGDEEEEEVVKIQGLMGIVEEAHNLRVVGQGERTIVLAHGFGTDQSVWKHLVPHLVDDHRVVLFDNMGAGPTNPDYFDFDRYATLDGYAFDLLAILEELRVDSCIFVGHSVSAAVGALASISRPDLFSKIVMLSASPRYLNDMDYFGGFEQEDLDQLFDAMRSNYKAWVSGFAPLAVGGDMESVAVQEFSRTLFNIRPDIALSVAQTIFQSDLRGILGLVTVPCHILQSSKDLAVPIVVSEHLHRNLGGGSIVEVMASDGHLPQLSSPDIVIPVLLRHIRYDIVVGDEP